MQRPGRQDARFIEGTPGPGACGQANAVRPDAVDERSIDTAGAEAQAAVAMVPVPTRLTAVLAAPPADRATNRAERRERVVAVEEALRRRRPALAQVRLQVSVSFAPVPIMARQRQADLRLASIVGTKALQVVLAPYAVATGPLTTKLHRVRLVGVGRVAASWVVANALPTGTVQVATPPQRKQVPVAKRRLAAEHPVAVKAAGRARRVVRLPRQDGPIARPVVS